MRVLAIGECMAELAPADEPGNYRLGFAGDTFNTAWYLARLRPDLDVAFFTAIGTDPLSLKMRQALTDAGIDDTDLQELPDSTLGMYLISLDKGERSFSYWRGQSAAREMMRAPEKLANALGSADLIYFSGITLAILDELSRGVLLDALKAERAHGKTVAFDPNLRPRLWDSMSEMKSATMEGARACDIALPSFEDDAHWFGDADPEATADRYTAAGATTVVVKNGANTVHYRTGDARGIYDVEPVSHVVDSTAAGDSFNAALLSGLIAGNTVQGSVEIACRLAAKVVQGRGALVPFDPALFTRSRP